MSDESFETDVLRELGDDRLTEIAGLLGTDAAGAQDVVRTTAGALAGGLQDKAGADDQDGEEARQAFAEVSEPPLQGVATLGGGLLSGGLMAGVLAKVAKPVAAAVAKKTGLPAATVTRVIEMLIPVLLAVLAKRAAGKGAPGSAAPAPGAGQAGSGGGLGDLLGQILGGGRK
ncbi:DUF937 domain-containing protein [Streptomyces bambusae]|uniref:DUF937 domain-containing protein n=1 Tax=Streptomyces bambusae TaxID=1550616 RepID=UPI001CFF8157|nr:DUF937 domain-containing protein [Streptomyces bambusae]MCB5169276.1 DUF937 domain-containing protein [Streptomyces bambusae]